MSLAAENAEVLESIAARGTDLSIPRTIDFAHLLYSDVTASEFKQVAEKAGYRVRMDIFPASELDGQEGVWDVVASSTMVPTVEQVTRCEAELDALARSFGGHADGWGFESS
jgi:TRAP-type C4-dicarboxylate transport system substrate-binding protein